MNERHTVRRGLCTAAATSATLLLALTACGTAPPAPEPDRAPVAVALQADEPTVSRAIGAQATAQAAAAEKAAQEKAAREKAARDRETEERRATEETRRAEPSTAPPPNGRGVCTTDPADRPNCRNPGGTIHPDGGDQDGDGVYEEHEPVGPGYRDPRAYDGGKTSGEVQCEYLRTQGIPC
ncbi:hypothetical protein [Streptomyces sp. NPDC005805]|uniref:hypothetical protein n=1 Tax=Streptomyces sp. NPDC005805 TaxID=3157068 RepID=UPI0033E20692